MTVDKLSYTAAGLFPWKILKQPALLASVKSQRMIQPVHAQFSPTNRCNRNCPMCSCSERDKKQEMSLGDAKKIIDGLQRYGCKAVTITGGGEPLLHPQFSDIVKHFIHRGIKIGLVTNGMLLHTIPAEVIRQITWCRISNDDSRAMTVEYAGTLDQAIKRASSVDWAFSHVASTEPNFEEIRRVVGFANEHDFTHVRLVSDLFAVESVELIEVRGFLRASQVSDDLVIYQGRKAYERGGLCFIGYLKPFIGTDCNIYACCGAQYALDPPSRDLPEELCLGSALELDKIYGRESKPLDGSICKRCYYGSYNEALGNMLKTLQHGEFV